MFKRGCHGIRQQMSHGQVCHYVVDLSFRCNESVFDIADEMTRMAMGMGGRKPRYADLIAGGPHARRCGSHTHKPSI